MFINLILPKMLLWNLELGGLILSDTDARFDLDEVLDHYAKKVREKGGNDEEITKVCTSAKDMFTETTPETYRMKRTIDLIKLSPSLLTYYDGNLRKKTL